ncbi:calcium-binding and coiled-coil domain-containing protein 2 isoform X1 [Cavia porcellus]|uniref:calcium-binding and coiled-coil domain-containing protein 2 isoform X1 n=2 Tax=Cavia porcellus TaxID=10141 RepID=UPI002FE065AB
MEKAEVEDLASAAVLLDRTSFSQVVFNSVDKFYVPGADVTCHYVFTQQFSPRRKDWIGIFRVGWKTTREYYTFMWVALPSDTGTDVAKQQEVQFKAYYLPKDDEYYQFCYVDQDGVVRGASVPFQFRPESEDDILVVTTKVKVEETEEHNQQLLQENQELKARCARLEEQSSAAQAELRQKQEELEALQGITKKLEQEAEAQKAHWDVEQLQLKEQDQKMRSENEQLGARVVELQSQLLNQERAMEKLIREDQEKTEQLQRLTKGNDQLRLSLTEQREQQRKLEQMVEEMKLRETAAVKTQADLMDPGRAKAVEAQLVQEVARLQAQVEAGKACLLEKYKECRRLHRQIRQLRAATPDENLDLSRRLGESKILCDHLRAEKEQMERGNELLQKENSRLLSYMGLDSDSVLPQVPASSWEGAPQKPVLIYGNPYSGIQESPTSGLLSAENPLRSPQQHAVEPPQALDPELTCPLCERVFPASELQVFEDHVYCHSL